MRSEMPGLTPIGMHSEILTALTLNPTNPTQYTHLIMVLEYVRDTTDPALLTQEPFRSADREVRNLLRTLRVNRRGTTPLRVVLGVRVAGMVKVCNEVLNDLVSDGDIHPQTDIARDGLDLESFRDAAVVLALALAHIPHPELDWN